MSAAADYWLRVGMGAARIARRPDGTVDQARLLRLIGLAFEYNAARAAADVRR